MDYSSVKDYTLITFSSDNHVYTPWMTQGKLIAYVVKGSGGTSIDTSKMKAMLKIEYEDQLSVQEQLNQIQAPMTVYTYIITKYIDTEGIEKDITNSNGEQDILCFHFIAPRGYNNIIQALEHQRIASYTTNDTTFHTVLPNA